MVKLIVSDMDGTLLQDGQTEVSKEAIRLIKNLSDNGVQFVVASGRAYNNLLKLFEGITDRIMYICENGSLIKYRNETVYKVAFDSELAKEIVEGILAKDECEVLISGENATYVIPKKNSYVEHMRNHVKNDVQIVDSFDSITEEIIKISVYNEDGIDKVSEYFANKWATRSEETVSGKCWQDFVPKGVNKGVALKCIQDKLKIERDMTMCFGDNYNDLAMFEQAYFSYAMSSANSEIRAKARYVAMSVEDIMYDVEKMITFNL